MSELLYIPELAKLMGITETAIRGRVQRDSDSIPPYFKTGRKLAWRRSTVQKWLDKKDSKSARVVG